MDRSTSQDTTPDSNPLLHSYKEWVLKTPFVTRSFMMVIVFVYLLSWIVDLTFFLANIPAFVVFYFQIYRLLLSPFVGNSILSVLLIFMFFPQMGARMELMVGSTAFLSLFVIFTVLTNISYVVLAFALWLLGMQFVMYLPASGFWAIIFGLITIECMQDPESVRRIMCIPIDITAKWYPLCLYAFFFLLGGADFACLLAIGLGYAHSSGYLTPFLLSKEYVSSVLESGTDRRSHTLGSTSSELGACCRQWWIYFSNCGERAMVAVVSYLSKYPGFILSTAISPDGLPQFAAGSGPGSGAAAVGRAPQQDGGGGSGSGMPDFSSWFNGGGGEGGSNTSQEPPPSARGRTQGHGQGGPEGRGRYSNVSTIDSFSGDGGAGDRQEAGGSEPAPEERQQKSHAFSGPGNKLSSSSGGGGAFAGAGIDRDAARRKRLAALEATTTSVFDSSSVLPVATPVVESERKPHTNGNRRGGGGMTPGPVPSAPVLPSSPVLTSAAAAAPDAQSTQLLVDMGFAPASVREALTRTGNDLNEALAILTA